MSGPMKGSSCCTRENLGLLLCACRRPEAAGLGAAELPADPPLRLLDAVVADLLGPAAAASEGSTAALPRL